MKTLLAIVGMSLVACSHQPYEKQEARVTYTKEGIEVYQKSESLQIIKIPTNSILDLLNYDTNKLEKFGRDI